MQAILGEVIPFTLQLIKSDKTFESAATVTFIIYDADFSIEVSEKTAVWDGSLYCYKYSLDPDVDWTTQMTDNYHLLWAVSGANDFASYYNEELTIHKPSYSSSSSSSSVSSSSSSKSSSSESSIA
jgi:hypothetical protein